MKILYLEDFLFIRKQVVTLLRTHGHIVVEADTASKAYSYYKSEQPDIAILDINVPSTSDGLQTAEYNGNGWDLALTMLQHNPNMYIILLSGHVGHESIIKEGFRSGIKDFISKPYDTQRLLNSIEKAYLHVASLKR